MNRVSIRTLILMIALFAFFVAYQCLAFIPAKPAGVACAARLQADPETSVGTEPSETAGDPRVGSAGEAPAVPEAVELPEKAPMRPVTRPADPNDYVPADGSEPAAGDIE